MHLDDPTLDRLRTGELEGPERARAEAHLAVCSRCAGALRELAAFAAAVERGYAEERAAAPARDWAAGRERIVAATSGRPGVRPWVRWIPQMAAVLLAVVAVGVLVERGVWGPEEAERIREEASAPAEQAARPEDAANAAADDSAPYREGADPAAGARSEAAPEGGPPPAPPAAFRDRTDAPLGAPAAHAPPAAAPEAGEREAEVHEERPAREAAAAELLRQRRAEADADLGKVAGPDAGPPLDRYFAAGRAALAAADSAAAGEAFVLWRDTLAAGGVAPADADSTRLDSAAALADSLAEFLGGPPE